MSKRKSKPPLPRAALNVRGLPRSLRDGFRVWCGTRGYTVQEAIEALMKQAIARDEVLPIVARHHPCLEDPG